MSTIAADVALEHVDLMDEDLFADGPPHELFARMRSEAPVLRCTTAEGGDFWSVTKAEDISAISKKADVFSSERKGVFIREGMPMPLDVLNQVILGMDPPRHVKYRGIVQMAFTPRIVAKQEEQIRGRIARLVDEVCERGECDLVSALSVELPLQVIAELLGVPQEDRQKLFDWTHQIELSVSDPTVSGPEALGQIGLYLAEKVGHRRAHPGDPNDDLTTALIQAEVDGEQLNDFEIAAMFGLLMFAGNDTTRNTISGGTLALIENPDQRQALLDRPDLIDLAVEEIIRWVTPVMWFRRTPLTDTEIRGVPVKEGDAVVLWYTSGSRDEEAIPDPMRFDLRDRINHSGFGGGGRHFCLGAPLARLELKLVFPEILRRMPDMELAGPIGRSRSNWVNGYTSLPVKFTPTARQG
ncbi:MAG TPA: cytochrome P450 [Solirubrobacteraceae bacterium]|nr:cytochrome P450 [Solirubrobacteraceae bacterium]